MKIFSFSGTTGSPALGITILCAGVTKNLTMFFSSHILSKIMNMWFSLDTHYFSLSPPLVSQYLLPFDFICKLIDVIRKIRHVTKKKINAYLCGIFLKYAQFFLQKFNWALVIWEIHTDRSILYRLFFSSFTHCCQILKWSYSLNRNVVFHAVQVASRNQSILIWLLSLVLGSIPAHSGLFFRRLSGFYLSFSVFIWTQLFISIS